MNTHTFDKIGSVGFSVRLADTQDSFKSRSEELTHLILEKLQECTYSGLQLHNLLTCQIIIHDINLVNYREHILNLLGNTNITFEKRNRVWISSPIPTHLHKAALQKMIFRYNAFLAVPKEVDEYVEKLSADGLHGLEIIGGRTEEHDEGAC